MPHLQDAARLQHQQDVRVDDGVQSACVVWIYRQVESSDSDSASAIPLSLFPLSFSFVSYLCAIIKTVAVAKRSRMAR